MFYEFAGGKIIQEIFVIKRYFTSCVQPGFTTGFSHKHLFLIETVLSVECVL